MPRASAPKSGRSNGQTLHCTEMHQSPRTSSAPAGRSETSEVDSESSASSSTKRVRSRVQNVQGIIPRPVHVKQAPCCGMGTASPTARRSDGTFDASRVQCSTSFCSRGPVSPFARAFVRRPTRASIGDGGLTH
ncbi:uncharacterized protein SCHCODRAFT_02256822 [Schizophyllum commune H4-8]|uniref:uncharacterized protein n=1 Tax=Schizophyllum commune (strain H4-8 / FGSC 9210) TaxID=578458 RepID=UPI002160C692|nr:uncharacterized protein SCHCODRAFT_02256822 [Schizophyllum commune H4-8]KAI5893592.1 hypothetical protein SCHCODRAFT_02256822 [Schizophyllum commune H4-8]